LRLLVDELTCQHFDIVDNLTMDTLTIYILTVDILAIDILTIDILTVDIIFVDMLGVNIGPWHPLHTQFFNFAVVSYSSVKTYNNTTS
jgi:hypothetical protein